MVVGVLLGSCWWGGSHPFFSMNTQPRPNKGKSRVPSMKTSTSSPYFPQTFEGPTRSSYFKSARCRGRMAKGQGTHSAATRPTPNIEAQRPPTMDKTMYPEGTAIDTIDEQLTERESSYHSRKANRKIRRARERRRKQKARKRNRRQLDGSNKDISADCAVHPVQLDIAETNGGDIKILGTTHEVWEDNAKGRKFGGVVVPVAGMEDLGTDQTFFGAGSMQPLLTEESRTGEREKRKGIRRAQTPVASTTVRTEPSHEYHHRHPPPPSRKRKRNETFEAVITKSVPIHAQDVSVGISGAQVHGHEGGPTKANQHPIKSAGACDESPNSQVDSPKRFISRRTPNTQEGVDAREQKELRTRSIVGADRFEEGPRKRKKNARPVKEGVLYDDTTSVTPLNCPFPKHTNNALAHHTTNQKPVKHCFDGIKPVLDTAIETPAKSLPRCARNVIRGTGGVSSYFASSAVQKMQKISNENDKGKKERTPAGKSVISWPPLTAETFGLIQEELESDAVSFTLHISNALLHDMENSLS